jgi:hypothetical protein
MRDKKCPDCSWVSVVDETGRRRLEMRWQPVVAPQTSGPAQPQAA